MIRILHTADIHIGHEFPSLREKGPEYRRQLLATFEQIIDLAVRQRVSLLLIAGDLFDTNAVLGTPVRTVLASFKKLEAAGIRACILPGTHDAYSEDSIYRFVDLPANVTVLTPQRVSHTYADLDLTVYGGANARGAKRAVTLPVSVPSHSRLMLGAAQRLAERLVAVDVRLPDVAAVYTVDVQTHASPDGIRRALERQLHEPVRWAETVRAMIASGVTTFIECGPGKVLTSLNRRIERRPDLTMLAVDDPDTLAAALAACREKHDG